MVIMFLPASLGAEQLPKYSQSAQHSQQVADCKVLTCVMLRDANTMQLRRLESLVVQHQLIIYQ